MTRDVLRDYYGRAQFDDSLAKKAEQFNQKLNNLTEKNNSVIYLESLCFPSWRASGELKPWNNKKMSKYFPKSQIYETNTQLNHFKTGDCVPYA